MHRKLPLLIIAGYLLLACRLFPLEWHTWKTGNIKVISAAKDTAYANSMLKELSQRIDAFQMKLGVYPEQTLMVKILPNRQEYSKITAGKGKLVESSQAFYSPHEHIIYVRSPDQLSLESYGDVLMHEYIHKFLDDTLDNVPLWFHEGMATYYSGQFNFDAYYAFTRYRFMGYRLSLQNMDISYPRDRNYWQMFYLTSSFAISYLESRKNPGWQQFWNIVGYYYNRETIPSAGRIDFISVFHTAFRQSLYAFSLEFDRVLKRYAWQFPFIGINALIFAMLPALIVFGWYRNRKKMSQLDDEHPEDESPEEEIWIDDDNDDEA